MPNLKRRWTILWLALAAILAVPTALWLSLTHQPQFYRKLAQIPPEQIREKAHRFKVQSLQLRNDIMNEPRWEAAFTDQQVNAWLAEDLVATFADQLPAGVHEPRVSFEMGRVILAFQLDEGPMRSIITVVAQPRVPEENVLSLTFEKIRAGLVPVPAEKILERIADHAIARGLEIHWERDGDLPVAMIRYRPHFDRRDIILERLQVLNGQIRLSGRSDPRSGGAAALSLPSKRVLQMKFPRRKVQGSKDVSVPRVSAFVKTTRPLS
jgi:hypothetical protein